jgi:thiamine-phosphate pyrophosphorylase
MRDEKRLSGLHVIVDSVALAEAALHGGAKVLQVRLKAGTDRERFAIVSSITELCRPARAMCIVNDRLDLALAAGATGVHLGDEDLPIRPARALAPQHFVIGATARDPDAARAREREGADYIGAGPVYLTESKDGLPEPIGLDGLEAIADRVKIPVIAVAGITHERLPEVIGAGAAGAAVIGAVARSPEPRLATEALVNTMITLKLRR